MEIKRKYLVARIINKGRCHRIISSERRKGEEVFLFIGKSMNMGSFSAIHKTKFMKVVNCFNAFYFEVS